jgi:hypothetical protein
MLPKGSGPNSEVELVHQAGCLGGTERLPGGADHQVVLADGLDGSGGQGTSEGVAVFGRAGYPGGVLGPDLAASPNSATAMSACPSPLTSPATDEGQPAAVAAQTPGPIRAADSPRKGAGQASR